MPSGKSYNRGIIVAHPVIPTDINKVSLLEYRKKKLPPISLAKRVKYKEIIRDAIAQYVGQICISQVSQNRPITVTQKKEELRKIRTPALRISKSSDGLKGRWIEKLLDLLDPDPNNAGSNPISLNTKDLLHRRLLHINGNLFELIACLRQKRDCANQNQMLKILAADEDGWKVILESLYPDQRIFRIMLRTTQVDKREKSRDPALTRLVNVLAPVWKEATGRTLKRQSINVECDKQTSYFGKWLSSVIGQTGAVPPPLGAIIDIVQAS